MLEALTYRREDGTFVGPRGGHPYHYIPSDPLFAAAEALAAEMGAALPFEPLPPQPASPTIPARVTRRQARLALHQAGLLDQVEALMASPETPAAIRITYEDATEWWRDDPIIQAIGPALGLTPGQVDDLFVAASTI